MESPNYNTSIQLHGFTPVRRRECDIITKQHIGGEQEQEWTTARCHRLLRALTSRVAILKKELSLISTTSGASQGSQQNGGKATKPARQRSTYPDDDMDWTKTGPKKNKLKRTYSNRGGRGRGSRVIPNTPRPGRALIPGEILVPTPILARARGELPNEGNFMMENSTREQLQMGRSKDSSIQLSGSIRSLKQSTTASRYAINEGLHNGLEALLRSTNEQPKTTRKGARSMFAMCLRAVPEYIEEEETSSIAYLEETGTKSAIDPRDIATEVYDDLEYLGTSGHGWKHLRVVVRSHGIKVLTDAIRDGLLDVQFCSILVTLCLQNSATEEAEQLLSSLLASGTYPAPKTLYDQIPRSLLLLRKFAEEAGRYTFQYQQLANLLSSGQLPLGWLASRDFRSFWPGVVQRISSGPMDSGVFAFLEIALPLIAGSDYLGKGFTEPLLEAIESTFSSLLTTILSILILSMETRNVETEDACGTLETLLRASLVQFEASYPEEGQSALLLVANLFAEVFGNLDQDLSLAQSILAQLRESLNGSDDSSEEYSNVVTFICSVARCCGRGSASSGFEHLEVLHSTLEKSFGDLEESNTFQSLIVDSAMAFANQTHEPDHINYASSVEKKFRRRNLQPQHQPTFSEGGNARQGFRWEEGIGEWITATPINNFKKNKDVMVKAESQYTTRLGRKLREAASFNNPVKASSSFRKQSISVVVYVKPREVADLADEETSDLDDSDSITSAAGDEETFSDTSICSSRSSISESSDFDDVPEQAPSKRRKLRSSHNARQVCVPSTSFSASSSRQTTKSQSGRQYSDRAPKLEGRALQSSQTWQTLDDSDDELSILSTSSSQREPVSMSSCDVTDSRSNSDRHSKRVRTSKQRKSAIGRRASLEAESEDELCL